MERKLKRILGILMTFVMVVGLLPYTALVTYATDPIPVTSITLSNPNIIISEYNSGYLYAMVEPYDATDSSITWTVDNPKVVGIRNDGDNIEIIPLGSGTANITATANDGSGVSATGTVTVFDNFNISVQYGENNRIYTANQVLEGNFLYYLQNELLNTYGNIDNITVSDSSIIYAAYENNEWILKVNKEFNNQQWVKLTINNQEYTVYLTYSKPDYKQVGSNKYVMYRKTNEGFDVIGRDENTFIQTTFAYGGYSTYMQVNSNDKILFDDFFIGKKYSQNDVDAYVTAKVRGKSVIVTYHVTNTAEEVKTVKIGSCADTQIYRDDRAPVSFTTDGIRMTSIDEKYEFKLSPVNDAFTTRWYGYYGERYGKVFVNRDDTSTYTQDSGVAWSWTMEVPAGATVERSALLSAGEAGTSEIIYDSNGGEGSMDPTVEIPDGVAKVTLNANEFTKEGYSFIGWDTDSAGTTVVYEDEQEIVIPDTDITLYAVWESLQSIESTSSGYNGSYDGNPHGITVSVTDPASGATVKYGTVEGTYNLSSSPTITNVSDSPLTVYYQIKADGYSTKTGSETVTISKAAITPTVSITGWTYGQEANAPSVTGNTGNGTVTYTYAVKNGTTFTSTVPTQAGEYTVKASIAATTNYAGGEATADFTISKAAIAPTVSIEGWTYGEDANEPSVTGNAGEADVIYTYAVKGSDEYTEIVPTQAGEYTVKAVVVESSNYEGEVATADFVISKASIESMNSLTAKQKASAKKMVYNGKNVELVKAPVSLPEGYVKAMYSINGGKTWTNAIPKGKNAGKYTVLVKFIGDSNHNDFECTALKSEITKANITITAIDKSTYLEADIAKLTYKISGAYVKGDNLGITLKTTAKKTSAVGKYPITISWNKNSNYNVTLKKGTYTIKDRVTATERAASKLTLDYGFKVNWTNDGIVVKWGKANKADRFEIYAAYCGPDNCKLIKAVSGKNQQYTFTKINGKNLDKTQTVKIYVVAYRKINGKEVRITNTIMAHVVGPQHKNTNVKKVTVSKNSYTLQKGKTAKISADVTLVNTKKDALPNSHCPKFRYTSDNKDVATVDSNGKIKAVGKGTCNVYVYGVNGCAAKVKVTVK